MKKINSLEKKIIDKTYQYETKKTFGNLVTKAVITILLFLGSFVIISAIWDIYTQQQTFEMFQLFNEDIEIIQDNIIEVLGSFYQESPIELLILLFLAIAILIFVILTFINNFGTIRNKIRSILKYWQK